jgi:hypothetical protein
VRIAKLNIICARSVFDFCSNHLEVSLVSVDLSALLVWAQEHTAIGQACRYMVLCALISATVVGEDQRMSKIEGKSRHRCQVHLLLAGEMLDPGVQRFFESAANILAPVVSTTKVALPLQPTCVKRADGVQQHHAGVILEAAQGICLVHLDQVPSSVTKKQLKKLQLLIASNCSC